MQLLKMLFAPPQRVDADAHASATQPPMRVPRQTAADKQATAPALIDLARFHVDAGRYGRSLALIDEALAVDPDNMELLFERASTLCGWGRHYEGRDTLLDLENRGMASGRFFLKLGWACFWTGNLEVAECSMRKAVGLMQEDWTSHFGLAMALQAQSKTDDARLGFQRALELCPDNRYCSANLVGCEIELGRFEKAEKLALRAVEVDPKDVVAWSNLGVALDRQDRYIDAIAAFEKAEALPDKEGENQSSFVNYALCLLRDGRTSDGIAVLESGLARYPVVSGQAHYSLSLLLSGRMEEGWEQYEFRWVEGPLRTTRATFDKPAWDGQNLQGKVILLRFEQGIGDFIQFIRYAPYLKTLGARVLLQLPEVLRRLAQSADGVDQILNPANHIRRSIFSLI
jgi:Flp pilus assembly protein TadD